MEALNTLTSIIQKSDIDVVEVKPDLNLKGSSLLQSVTSTNVMVSE